MATVFLARASGAFGFQRLFAIKRLHPHLARETEFVEMFLDEARLAAHIHHPNVVPILEVGQSDGGYYLVMDYVEGDTLARLIARAAQAGRSVPHGVVVRILLDALAGLHAAHEMKDERGEAMQIVHRDVSPQNILVGADGTSRLLDFGVARATARLATTRTGQLKGKLAYMAPEQARGLPVDRRADVFACGVVLWEALAVRRLFKGEGEAETLHRVLNDLIPPPSTIRPEIPEALDAICMRALERDVEKRYASAQELADDLERVGRSLSLIGSVRDVAECLQSAVGSELSQQREAVRAWLSRSEPSGPTSGSPAVPRPATSVTRIEGHREGSGSNSAPRPSPEVTRAMAPPSPAAVNGAYAAYAPGSVPPEKVSSVSSAVLPLVERTGQAPATANASKGGPARVLVALAAVAILAGGGLYGVRRFGHDRGPGGPSANGGTTTATATVAASPRAPTHEATPPPPTPEPTGSAASSAAPAESVAPSAPVVPVVTTTTTRRHPRPPPAQTAPGTTSRPAPATSAIPDDLSNNPYR